MEEETAWMIALKCLRVVRWWWLGRWSARNALYLPKWERFRKCGRQALSVCWSAVPLPSDASPCTFLSINRYTCTHTHIYYIRIYAPYVQRRRRTDFLTLITRGILHDGSGFCTVNCICRCYNRWYHCRSGTTGNQLFTFREWKFIAVES